MKSLRVSIRPIGNSQGVVIPKLLLAQAGLEGEVDMSVESDALVLRRPARPVRDGWAQAAKRIAKDDAGALAMGEFGNEGDDELSW
jgi:antitoxin MazE